jgi:hypothetical protein
MTFEEWMAKVDAEVWRQVGCSVHDLPDCNYRDWYEDEVAPATAARRAIKGTWD